MLVGWGRGVLTDNSQCVLCGICEETRDHLFFQCPYSKCVWNAVLGKLDLSSPCITWDSDVEQALNWFKGSDLICLLELGEVVHDQWLYMVSHNDTTVVKLVKYTFPLSMDHTFIK